MKYNQIIKKLLVEDRLTFGDEVINNVKSISMHYIDVELLQVLDIMQDYLGWKFDLNNVVQQNSKQFERFYIKGNTPDNEDCLVVIIDSTYSSSIFIKTLDGESIDCGLYIESKEREVINNEMLKLGKFVSYGLDTDDFSISDDTTVIIPSDKTINLMPEMKEDIDILKYYKYKIKVYCYTYTSSSVYHKSTNKVFIDPHKYVLDNLSFLIYAKDIYNHDLCLYIGHDQFGVLKDYRYNPVRDIKQIIPPQVKAAVAHKNNDPNGLVNNLADLF